MAVTSWAEPVARWDAGGEFAATTAQVLGERMLGGQSAWTGGGLARAWGETGFQPTMVGSGFFTQALRTGQGHQRLRASVPTGS